MRLQSVTIYYNINGGKMLACLYKQHARRLGVYIEINIYAKQPFYVERIDKT